MMQMIPLLLLATLCVGFDVSTASSVLFRSFSDVSTTDHQQDSSLQRQSFLVPPISRDKIGRNSFDRTPLGKKRQKRSAGVRGKPLIKFSTDKSNVNPKLPLIYIPGSITNPQDVPEQETREGQNGIVLEPVIQDEPSENIQHGSEIDNPIQINIDEKQGGQDLDISKVDPMATPILNSDKVDSSPMPPTHDQNPQEEDELHDEESSENSQHDPGYSGDIDVANQDVFERSSETAQPEGESKSTGDNEEPSIFESEPAPIDQILFPDSRRVWGKELYLKKQQATNYWKDVVARADGNPSSSDHLSFLQKWRSEGLNSQLLPQIKKDVDQELSEIGIDEAKKDWIRENRPDYRWKPYPQANTEDWSPMKKQLYEQMKEAALREWEAILPVISKKGDLNAELLKAWLAFVNRWKTQGLEIADLDEMFQDSIKKAEGTSPEYDMALKIQAIEKAWRRWGAILAKYGTTKPPLAVRNGFVKQYHYRMSQGLSKDEIGGIWENWDYVIMKAREQGKVIPEMITNTGTEKSGKGGGKDAQTQTDPSTEVHISTDMAGSEEFGPQDLVNGGHVKKGGVTPHDSTVTDSTSTSGTGTGQGLDSTNGASGSTLTSDSETAPGENRPLTATQIARAQELMKRWEKEARESTQSQRRNLNWASFLNDWKAAELPITKDLFEYRNQWLTKKQLSDKKKLMRKWEAIQQRGWRGTDLRALRTLGITMGLWHSGPGTAELQAYLKPNTHRKSSQDSNEKKNGDDEKSSAPSSGDGQNSLANDNTKGEKQEVPDHKPDSLPPETLSTVKKVEAEENPLDEKTDRVKIEPQDPIDRELKMLLKQALGDDCASG